MTFTSRLTLGLAVALLLAVTAAPGGNLPPRFTFSPLIAGPGDPITLTGSHFDPASTIVAVILANEAIEQSILGFAFPVNGNFEQTFILPPGYPPGSYLVRVGDNQQKSAINLIGTLSITSPTEPWFSFSPTTSVPGGGIEITANGFIPASPWAVVGLLDQAGAVSVLGSAVLNNGGFTASFDIPANLMLRRAYQVVVRDFQEFAAGVSGPLSLNLEQVSPVVPVGTYPIGVGVHPFTNRIYVPNGADNTVSVLDGATDQVLSTIPVGEIPCAVAVNPLLDRVYIANVGTNDVTVIDTQTDIVVNTVPVGDYPCAVGVIPSNGRVFVGNYIGDDVTVIDGNTDMVETTIPIGGAPFGMGVNPSTSRVYIATGGEDTVTVVDGTSNQVVTTVPVGRAPDAIGVNWSSNQIYAANYFSETVSVIEGNTNRVIATIRVGKEPSGVGVNPFTGRVYVGNYASNTVSVIDGFTNRVVSTLAVGQTPDGVAVNPFTGRVYCVNSNTNDVSVIQDPPLAGE